MDQILAFLDNTLGFLSTNTYASGALTLFLSLYASTLAPKLPHNVLALFDNTVVKLIVMVTILLLQRYSFMVALSLSIAFLVTLRLLTHQHIMDFGFGSHHPVNLAKGKHEDHEVHQNKLLLHQHDDRHLKNAVDHTDENGPQPQEVDSHHPQHAVDTQVAAKLLPSGLYQGPQGLQEPQGFHGIAKGADYGTPDSEL